VQGKQEKADVRRLVLILIAIALLLPLRAHGRLTTSLRIADAAPLTLRGSHFRPRERVYVTVVMGEKTLSRSLRAGALGGFTVRFVGVRLDYCALPLVIKAVGTRSGLVRAQLPLVDCAAP
jgi:hypothetical protein